jgi:site-specific DNA recombinase
VRTILKNERYLGRLVWNKTRKLRVPGTGRRVHRPRPESEWVTKDAPHLRIVPDELWIGVQHRFDLVRSLWQRKGAREGLAVGQQQRHLYLFSGFLKCGECGGSITLVSGRRRNGAENYGCSIHHQRGISVCTNNLLIRRDDLESRLLQRLQEAVLRDEVVDYAVERLSEELQRRHEALSCQLLALRDEKQRIESEIANLVESIAAGKGSASVMSAIVDREDKIRAITDRLIDPGPESFQEKLDDLRTFALQRLSNLRDLLGRTDVTQEARALLAEQFGKFTLNRVKDAQGWSYKAQGSVNFFGDSLVRVDGAGGQNRTGYARLFRAALYH